MILDQMKCEIIILHNVISIYVDKNIVTADMVNGTKVILGAYDPDRAHKIVSEMMNEISAGSGYYAMPGE